MIASGLETVLPNLAWRSSLLPSAPIEEPVTHRPLTDAFLGEIADCCHSASPGPWTHREDGLVEADDVKIGVVAIACKLEGHLRPIQNGEFIALARNELPRLVSELQRLRAVLAEIAGGSAGDPAAAARAALDGSKPA